MNYQVIEHIVYVCYLTETKNKLGKKMFNNSKYFDYLTLLNVEYNNKPSKGIMNRFKVKK